VVPVISRVGTDTLPALHVNPVLAETSKRSILVD